MARRAPLCSPVAQLSGSAFCGRRTTPPFCRSFCRFPQTPSCSKALGPVALRANHPLPRSPRFRGEWGWERPPLRSTIYSPGIRTYARTYFRGQGSLPARADGPSDPCGKASLRMAHGSFRMEGVGRMLALHSAESYQERGAAVTVSVGEGARRPGLTVSLSPRWGASATANEALWQEHVYRATRTMSTGQAVDARAAYGLRLGAGRLLTPFWVYGESEFQRRLAVGLEVSSRDAFGVELAGERASRPDLGSDDYRISLLGSIGFGGQR